jgi:hypothetical protein
MLHAARRHAAAAAAHLLSPACLSCHLAFIDILEIVKRVKSL